MEQQRLRLLVICTGNRARSQMAHRWFNHFGGTFVQIDSAGIEPKGVHPLAVTVMSEVGIDISDHTSDPVDQYVKNEYDLVLTVCDTAKEACPVFSRARRTMHQAFEDPDYPDMPAEEFANVFRRNRDEIGEFCRGLLSELRPDIHGLSNDEHRV